MLPACRSSGEWPPAGSCLGGRVSFRTTRSSRTAPSAPSSRAPPARARSAREDLVRILEIERLDPVAGALLFSCNGRGKGLFGKPDHDVTALRSALGDIPVAGFFAAGELGPVGGRNFVHGFTASMLLFRR